MNNFSINFNFLIICILDFPKFEIFEERCFKKRSELNGGGYCADYKPCIQVQISNANEENEMPNNDADDVHGISCRVNCGYL